MKDLLAQAAEFTGYFEGFRNKPYQNPGDRPTIGYGTTFYPDGRAVTLKDPPISKEDGLAFLKHYLQEYLDKLQTLVSVSLTDNQKIALLSFSYNEGIHAFETSTMRRYINSGRQQDAADSFLKWTRAGNDPQRLLARREKERTLFLTPDA